MFSCRCVCLDACAELCPCASPTDTAPFGRVSCLLIDSVTRLYTHPAAMATSAGRLTHDLNVGTALSRIESGSRVTARPELP
jgi:hypothetical protein